MNEIDVGIGARLAQLRGDVSQAALAEEMRRRGWDKWSQATVWSVESARRPLRLAEGADIAEILGVSVADLLWSQEAGALIGRLRDAIVEVDKSVEALGSAGFAFEDARAKLRKVVSMMSAEGAERWSPAEVSRLRELLTETDKRMKWGLADVLLMIDTWDKDLSAEGGFDWREDDDGVDPEAS